MKLPFKFINNIGENTDEKNGESPMKLFHRSPVNHQCGEFIQFTTLPTCVIIFWVLKHLQFALSNSSGSSIAFPPLLTPSPPFSGYNSTGGDGGGRLRTPDMVSAFDDLIRFDSLLKKQNQTTKAKIF